MKKFLSKLLAGVLTGVMIVMSFPNMSYADELILPDVPGSELEAGMDATELSEENADWADEKLSEESDEEEKEESVPVEETSEEEYVSDEEEISEEECIPDENIGNEGEFEDEEEIESDEVLEDSFSSETVNAVNPTSDYLLIEGTTVKGFKEGWKPKTNGASKIVIPEGITEIGDKAFYAYDDENTKTDMDMLFNSIVLPSTLKTIGAQAFYNQWALTSVSIPSKVTKIGEGAFSECSHITEINIPDGVTEIEDNVFYNANSLEKITLGNRVTRIGKRAFASTAIQAITIPKSVKSIGESAFERCRYLKNINIPTGVTEIEDSVFSSCSELTSITIPKTVTSIGDKAFRYCTKLETLPFSSGVKTIGEYAFSSCGIETLVIPDCVTSIGKYAFSNNSSLKSVTIGKNVSHMGERVFNGDEANYLVLDNLTVKSTKLEDVTELNSNSQLVYPFGYVKVKSLVFDDAVTYIPSNTFNNIDLSECDVIIPANVTSIHHHAFSKTWFDKENDSNIIKSISFAGNKVIEIGDSAFEYSEIPSGVRLPDSVENIGEKAFFNCDFYPYSEENPLKVFLPQNLKKIQANAFAKFGNKDYYKCDDTNFAEKNKSANMYFYVPADMESIADNAFGSRYGLDMFLDDPIYRMNFVVEGDSASESVKLLTALIKAQEFDYSYSVPADRISYDGSEKKYCKINYVLNGGVFKSRTPESGLISGEQIKFTGYPSKVGYVFDGWYSDSKLKNKVEIADGKTLATDGYELSKESFKTDVTLYAKWKLATYKVKFDLNVPGNELEATSTGTMDDQVLTYSKATALRKNTYSFAKWKFKGWNTKADGKGVAYKDAASVKNLASEQDAEVILYAQWQPLTYTVKFDGNTAHFGGKVSGKMPAVKYAYYTDLEKNLPTNKFTCPGMTFKGWRLQSDLYGVAEYNNGQPVKGYTLPTQLEDVAAANKNVVTLYAVWERNTYKLEIYDYSGTTLLNSGDSDKWFESGYSLSAAYSKAVTDKSITGTEILGKGYSFENFYTVPNGKGKKYTAASVMALEYGSTLKLYLKKKPISYKLVCDLDGGKAGKKLPAKYTVETAPFALIDDANLPTKPGYIFAGWEICTDENVLTDTSTTITKSTDMFIPANHTSCNTIKAKWTPVKYSVYLDPKSKSYKEGSLSNVNPCICDDETHIYTDIINLYDNSKRNLTYVSGWNQTNSEEYSITRWSTKQDGKGKVFSNGTVNLKDLISYADGTDSDGNTKITLYAVWTPKKYNIVYNLDGGKLSSAPKTYSYNAKKTVKISAPKKTGYKFAGWTVTPADKFDSANSCIKAEATGNIELKANWEVITYSVKIDPNSKTATYVTGSGANSFVNIQYDDSRTFDIGDNYINPGYTLTGYNTKPNGKGIKAVYDETTGAYRLCELTTQANKKVILYAQWTPNTYSITYNAVNTDNEVVTFSNWVSGYASNKNPGTYVYSPKGKITLKKPVKYGYVFEGWYENYNPASKTFSNKVTKIDRSVQKNVILYAKWRTK